jgi:hypothetical protein
MQMLNVLILVSIGLALVGFIYSIVADELEGKQVFGFIVGLTFYILAAVFGGTWALAIGLIYGVGGRFLFLGNESNSKTHPIKYFVSFVMGILFIIAIIRFDNGGAVAQTITDGVLLVK